MFQRVTALGIVWVLSMGCSSTAAEQGKDGSGGSGPADSSFDAGTPDTGSGGSPTDADVGAAGMAGATHTTHYPDAPEAPAEKSWNPPTLEPVIEVGPHDDWHARDDAALAAITQMYIPETGSWNAGYRWTFANAVEAVESSYARTGGDNHWDLVLGTYERQKGDNFLNDGGYDDQLWWGHAWLRAYELTGDSAYLDMVKIIFADALNGWEPAVCGGGMWWQKTAVYKNAITNELFLLLAASLHNHVAGDSGPGSYIDWAHEAWQWFSDSGMINASNLINDGLTDACENNQQTTWTYNQGVILGALVEMYKATGDSSYLIQAEDLADASTTSLVDENGILQEPCGGPCNHDQVSFKGLYVRNLAHLYDWTHKASYYDFIVKNARSAWLNARNGDNQLGSQWSGPFDSAGATRQSSAMFALSALADKYSQASVFLRQSGGPSFSHALGERTDLLGWACDAEVCPSAGLMQAGPYVSYIPPGTHELHVRLMVNETSTSEAALVTIDVFDVDAKQVLAALDVPWSRFVEPNVAEDFVLGYTHAAGASVEYRVHWNAVPAAPRVTLSDVSLDGEYSLSAANLEHECGRLDISWHWSADRFRDAEPCYLTRGGNLRLEDGEYVAHFELKVDDFAIDDQPVASVAVVNREEGKVIASLQVSRKDFPNIRYKTFALPFRAYSGYHYDFLTQWLSGSDAPRLTQRGVYVRKATSEQVVALPFNARGMSTVPGDAALDGVGSALDLSLIGAERQVALHHFTFGNAGNNVVEGGGGEIEVPVGQYRSLELLLLATNGTQVDQQFTIAYVDGTSEVVTRSISDWIAFTPQPDERIAFNLPYRWSTTDKQFGNFHVFHHSFPLSGQKPVRAFTLPPNPNVKLLAATLSAQK